ncbi:MAG: GNAT family N-acetyltransferase [Actinobacteria bacterium]|nr:GNAT family N-acetyltransferase [Actinomycetota bacterium]
MAEIRDATWEDFDAVVDLLDRRSRAAFGASDVQAAFIRQRWQLPGATLGWVATEGATLTGYASLDSTHEATVAAAAAATGDALLATVEESARARGYDHIAITAVDSDRPLAELVRRRGLHLDREYVRMWRPLAGEAVAPSWPTGTTVRSYEQADGERVHALLDEAYAGWEPDYVPRAHDEWVAFMTDHAEFDPELWFLVERDAELVACALHWRESEGRGWVKDIAVRESERGRGLAKALLHHAFAVYKQRGVTEVGLKVDTSNPTGAPQLYDRVGFVTDQRYGIWIRRL